MIREKIICRLMQVHLAIMRGRDGTRIREHKMDATFAFRCLKGNVFAENEYMRLFNAEGRLAPQYFERLLVRVHSQAHRLSELEEVAIERYRSVVSAEPEVKPVKPLVKIPDFSAMIKRTVEFISAPPAMSPQPA